MEPTIEPLVPLPFFPQSHPLSEGVKKKWKERIRNSIARKRKGGGGICYLMGGGGIGRGSGDRVRKGRGEKRRISEVPFSATSSFPHFASF